MNGGLIPQKNIPGIITLMELFCGPENNPRSFYSYVDICNIWFSPSLTDDLHNNLKQLTPYFHDFTLDNYLWEWGSMYFKASDVRNPTEYCYSVKIYLENNIWKINIFEEID